MEDRPADRSRRGVKRRGGHEPPRAGWAREMRIAGAEDRPEHDLHICPRCGSNLVQPVSWGPLERRRWRVDLRCPECQWTGGGAYEQSVLDRFDEILDDGVSSLLEELEQLACAHMEEETARFLTALRRDRILPEDF
jgi:hypothetical protein